MRSSGVRQVGGKSDALLMAVIALCSRPYIPSVHETVTDHSPAYNERDISYLYSGDTHLEVCDHMPDFAHTKVEARDRQSGTRLVARDPDGAGGRCGHARWSRNAEAHCTFVGENVGGWSLH